jgi:DNA uptake protein ComE-like DNA-binding protein
VTPELLYGLDENRNLVVDESEIARGVLTQIDNSLGQINRGWSAYLTTYAAERAVTPTGTAKVNINNSDLRALQAELQQVVDAETANFILAYRQFGPSGGGAPGTGGSAASLTINLDTPASTEINSLLDLVGASVDTGGAPPGGPPGTPGGGGSSPPGGAAGSPGGAGGSPPGGTPAPPGGTGGLVVESPWQDSAALYSGVFLDLLDKLTTSDEPARGGRVNINMASRPVLLSVPGLTEMQADQILTMREPTVDRQTSPQRHAVWLLANGVVTLEEMKTLDQFVTAGGDVYTGQIVGFFDGLAATSRACVTLDRTDATTLVVGWEDLSKLGPGFTAEELGAAAIAE